MRWHIGADFHRAMVATAPGEKLLIGRRPVRNWTRRKISSLFLCRKLHLFLGKSTETAATGAALLTPISTGGETKEGGGEKRGEARRCMHRCMNFVHTVAFYNCRPYRYCHFQFVVIAFYCIYMYVYELCTQLRLTTVFKE